MTELTGMRAETVTGLRRADDGSWVVTVEALELVRVPNTMDVIGTYEVTLDDEGELVSFRRTGRHRRAETCEGRAQ